MQQGRDFHLPGRSPVLATHGMAATSMPAATLTALDVLRAGGNAVDAAVAACAALCVIEPQSTGIGGDCFCLYATAGQRRVIALNGSGRAAAGYTIDWFEDRGIAALEPTSPHGVTIPGAVSAWETLLAAHGTRGLDELLAPAIRFAEDGWPVHHRVALDWADSAEKLRAAGSEPFLPGGATPAPGEMFRQPALAATLRRIGRDGARAFYEGEVAAEMAAALRARGGLQTEADFAAGRTAAEFVAPIRLPWKGYEVWECPPNGSGLIALIMLGILDGMPAADGPLDPLRLHRHIEAARLAYRDRDAVLADPAYAEVPVARLLSPEYLAAQRARIRDDGLIRDASDGGGLPAHPDTVYLCVVDRDGNAVSFINSLFQAFGSGILAPRSGVLLQNRGLGFRLQRGHPNCVAPGKRPMHTIIPGMLTRDGEAVMPFGVMGGHFQPMGQSLFLTNMFDHGLDIQQALDLPRVMPAMPASDPGIEVERGIPASVRDRLARLGHVVRFADRPHGGGQAIRIDRARGALIGGSDPRKDGMALGW
ncbi:MAG TPA: gamma-glutamyltransferase family protein [Acetobacteraceae bacterium]|nr:gamma-glutamyltransferase family protein [Acetobacteraceae bacterium]